MEEKSPDTLEKIQQSALEEFSEKGFLGASLRQIVKNAGVTTGAFYGYYSSKEALFATCAAHGVPAIAAMGRKGGSTVAAAVCNALVYSAAEMLDPAARGWK